ncbi:hypothetical protein H2201_006764 [Coniosporium apollinis]|uniref:Uncharacterized protein n=2 Tax=Coniosporium TaxID=2810619 RepID=A0ABQ9NMQ1_9PEZI|nr:hypothetical protein H2199_007358 [Cladosporium sp. JES 115]KAJ9660872.1 hypothetical protein H2201_006764 [Coniosporium apollinis]
MRSLQHVHEHLATIMRNEAAKLFILPREVRDIVYEHLYSEHKPIRVGKRNEWSYPRSARRWPEYGLLPLDTAGLMSSYHVGAQIAMEAAMVFYSTNTFHIEDLKHTAEFLNTDQYGVGILPRDHVRKLSLPESIPDRWIHKLRCQRIRLQTLEDVLPDSELEDQYEDWLARKRLSLGRKLARKSQWRTDSRSLLEPLCHMPRLQAVEARVWGRDCWPDEILDLPLEERRYSPLFIRLRQNGVKLKLEQYEVVYDHSSDGGYETSEVSNDISSWFDEPTDTDRAFVKKSEQNASAPVRRDARWARVKLYEHFQLYKSRRGL